MKRSKSVAWLVLVIVLSSVGVLVLLFAPLKSCPTCGGLTKEFSRIAQQHSGIDPAILDAECKIYCPECNDRGKVAMVKALKGSILDSDVFHLIHDRGQTGIDFNSLGRLETRSGRAQGEASGAKFYGRTGQWFGDFRFIRSEEKDYLLVTTNTVDWTTAVRPVAGIILLGTDGRILDYVTCAWRDMKSTDWIMPSILHDAPDGAAACVTGLLNRPELQAPRISELVEVHLADGSTSIPTKALSPVALRDGLFRVKVSGDRLHFIEVAHSE
jgi:hypothetical protein